MSIGEPLSFILKNEGNLVEDACQYVLAAAQYVILHGNSRNFLDALDALKSMGAITKSGRIAFNRKGATYRALQDALISSKMEREEFVSLHSHHKGPPTEIMEANAKLRASTITATFKETFIARK